MGIMQAKDGQPADLSAAQSVPNQSSGGLKIRRNAGQVPPTAQLSKDHQNLQSHQQHPQTKENDQVSPAQFHSYLHFLNKGWRMQASKGSSSVKGHKGGTCCQC